MILAIDIGNTTVALGGIRDGRVCFVARMDTVRTRTAAEYRVEMDKIFAHRRHPERPMRFEVRCLEVAYLKHIREHFDCIDYSVKQDYKRTGTFVSV